MINNSLVGIIVYVCMLIPTMVTAATMNSDTAFLYKKLKSDSNEYDRYDLFCKNKKVDAVCTIPIDMFEGGGNGYCTRLINEETKTIDLRCQPVGWAMSTAEIQMYPWRLDEDDCEKRLKQYILHDIDNQHDLASKLVCGETPLAIDSACKDLSEGDSCSTYYDYHTINENNKIIKGKNIGKGICTLTEEKRNLYEGRELKVYRKTIQCKPKNQLNLKDINVYEK